MSGTLKLNDTVFATENNGAITTDASTIKVGGTTVIDSNRVVDVSEMKVGGNTVIDSNRAMDVSEVKVGGNIIASHTGVEGAGEVSLGNVTLGGGQFSGIRNLIINGNFRINQRGAASITATSAAYNYDRWYYGSDGKLYQGIEDQNIVNGTYTISWSDAGSDLTAEYVVSTDTTAGDGPDSGLTWTPVLNKGNITVNEGTEFSKHLWIRFGGTLSNLSKVQVEYGTVATPFEHRPISVELGLCQRYFEKSYNLDVAPGTSTQEGSFRTMAPRTLSNPVDYMYSVQYKVTKRASTDLVIYSTDGTQGSVRNISEANNTTLRGSLGGASNLMTSFDITDTRFYAFQWTATAEL